MDNLGFVILLQNSFCVVISSCWWKSGSEEWFRSNEHYWRAREEQNYQDQFDYKITPTQWANAVFLMSQCSFFFLIEISSFTTHPFCMSLFLFLILCSLSTTLCLESDPCMNRLWSHHFKADCFGVKCQPPITSLRADLSRLLSLLSLNFISPYFMFNPASLSARLQLPPTWLLQWKMFHKIIRNRCSSINGDSF